MPHAHQLGMGGVSKRPHLHLLKPEVLLGGQLRAVVRGARGLGLAVSFPEVDVDPQPEVMMLPSHALRREGRQHLPSLRVRLRDYISLGHLAETWDEK